MLVRIISVSMRVIMKIVTVRFRRRTTGGIMSAVSYDLLILGGRLIRRRGRSIRNKMKRRPKQGHRALSLCDFGRGRSAMTRGPKVRKETPRQAQTSAVNVSIYEIDLRQAATAAAERRRRWERNTSSSNVTPVTILFLRPRALIPVKSSKCIGSSPTVSQGLFRMSSRIFAFLIVVALFVVQVCSLYVLLPLLACRRASCTDIG